MEETANFSTFTEKLNFLYSDLDQPFSLINKSKTNTRILITVKPVKNVDSVFICLLNYDLL